MIHDLSLASLTGATVILTLAAVYLWSSDAARRTRAWRLLKLLLRR